MSIYNKIEKIRRQPEHVKMRYVLGCTMAGTLLVILIWFISLASQRQQITLPEITPEQKQAFDDLKNQTKSLKDATSKTENVVNNNVTTQQRPAAVDQNQNPQNSNPQGSIPPTLPNYGNSSTPTPTSPSSDNSATPSNLGSN